MRPVLGYVRRLTMTPSQVSAFDAEEIYAAGRDERGLLDAV